MRAKRLSVDLPMGTLASSLPQVCAVTGDAASSSLRLTAPSVVRKLLLNHLANRMAGGSFVELPVSSAVTEYIRADRRAGAALLLGAMGAAILFGIGVAVQPLLGFGGLVCLFVVAVVAARERHHLRSPGRFPVVRRRRGGTIRVRGVHEAFVRALEQQRGSR